MEKVLSTDQVEKLLTILSKRFEANKKRHENVNWEDVLSCLNIAWEKTPEKLWSLWQLEDTGGEPDLIEYDHKTGACVFYDCALQTPSGRRNLCYDGAALAERKKFKPESSAMDMAAELGVKMLNESQYRKLQELGEFDTKTSSWVHTPANIRELGGALFCDRRFDTVFTYHNGAQSYYKVRGFRASLTI